jgi:hypothetical protein
MACITERCLEKREENKKTGNKANGWKKGKNIKKLEVRNKQK